MERSSVCIIGSGASGIKNGCLYILCKRPKFRPLPLEKVKGLKENPSPFSAADRQARSGWSGTERTWPGD